MILRKTVLLAMAIALIAASRPASSALLTYSTKSSFDAALITNALIPTQSTNFDSQGTGAQGLSFSQNGIGFTSPNPMRISSGTTSSPSNFLGYDDIGFPDFVPGDTVTIALPVGSRAIGLNIVTDTIPDALSFGTLTVGAASVNTQGAGTLIAGSFRSYFVGIIDDATTITSASVGFTNAGLYRLDDVGVAAVPEPSSLALAAVAGLAGLARRRVRRSM